MKEIAHELRFLILRTGHVPVKQLEREYLKDSFAPTFARASLRHAATEVTRRLERFLTTSNEVYHWKKFYG